jgi:hypothetical protein
MTQDLLPAWVMKLRDRPCLPDTRDQPHLPAELLRRTPETEYLIDVEPFVNGRLDREATRALLDLLGVRHSPDGPARLIERLRALAKASRAPGDEVDKWYRRLDQLLDGAGSDETRSIKDMFHSEKLIQAHDGTWVTVDGVFLSASEEDVPDAALIRPSVASLSIWHRIGVAERPSADLAMQWLATLASGSELATDDARRVRGLLARYPRRIWEEVGHWMNLLGEWVQVETLTYALSLQSLFRWSQLYDDVKRKTADFQRLPADAARTEPFVLLAPLAGKLEERFTHTPATLGRKDAAAWLNAFGQQLRRIQFADQVETDRVQREATAIASAAWVEASSLEVVPYLDGVPAGTARLADVLWQDGALFATPLTKAKLAKRVPEEIGKTLSPELRAALTYAFERSSSEINAYLEENFNLGPLRVESVAAIREASVDASTLAVGAADADKVYTEEPPPNDGVLESSGGAGSVSVGANVPHPEPVTSIQVLDNAVNRPRVAHAPPKPTLIERFAKANGYKPDGLDRFFAPDGSWIARSNGGRFPWEMRARNGELLRHFYPKEHCLERDPLQIETDIWSLLDQKPEVYAILLLDPAGKPVELTGARLRAMREQDQLTIHPATYRLVYDGDQ